MLIDSIFNHLLHEERFYNVVYPHLGARLFSDSNHQRIFKEIKKYSEAYSKHPDPKDIKLMLHNNVDLDEDLTEDTLKALEVIRGIETTDNVDFLIDETEKWVKDRVMELAILDSVDILKSGKPRGAIEQRIKEALAMSFKNELGLQYLADADKQFEFYTSDELGLPVDLKSINEAVGRGFRKKAIYIFIGKTHVGKTLWLCHIAASLKRSGIDGVYFTAEMSENAITQRIDANVLDMEMNSLGRNLTKDRYMDKVQSILKKYKKGRWFIKEYPPTAASKNHITAYLQELKLKEGMVPKVIILDYLNMFASSRLPPSAILNSYIYMKAVIEEMRALCVEEEVPLITATQLNREYANSDVDRVDLTGTGESWAMPQTADWMGAIVQPPELFDENKYLLKVLKNRFDENLYKVYTLGVDRSHMRLSELAEEDQGVPIVVRDRLQRADVQRQLEQTDDERVFVFDDEV